MVPLRNKKALVVVVVILALFVFLLPALVAYRYTARDERNQFLTHPWRGWSFALAALAVPGDSQLKTSGMALRKAAWLFKGTSVDPREVQLEFVRKRHPYPFTHTVNGRTVTTTVKPSYRFIWQVRGMVDTLPDKTLTIVALLDYRTGRLLYDIRSDLLPSQIVPEPVVAPSASP
jgi:hypothetical protein